MTYDFIIIGAGLSGLNAASKILNLGLGNVLVLEKSRGVGGRMATRRTLGTRFDHGAQFYRVKADVSKLHQFWSKKEISHQWFVSPVGDHWCAKSGMTALAKAMAEKLDIDLEKQIKTIKFENNKWKIISDKSEVWECQNLIITSPLPQTINLLEEISHEDFADKTAFSEIKKITYTKALIALVSLEEDIDIDSSGYLEFQEGDFFSVTDQRKKGVSEIFALTLTMSANFSEAEFDHADEDTLAKIKKIFLQKYPKAKIKEAELKKWRYCKPTSQYKKLFLEMAPRLYLIGDAFGGSSLLGAVRSSDALSDYLLSKQIQID